MRVLVNAFIVAVVLMWVLAPAATAQTQSRPRGGVRGLFGGEGAPNPARTSQQLSLWFDLGGGNDGDAGGETPPTNPTPNFDKTLAGAIRYWIGREARSFEAQTRLYLTTSQAVEAAQGGEISLSGNMGLRGRSNATASFRVANESARLFGAFGPGITAPGPTDEDAVPVSDVSPPQGIVETRWISLGGAVDAYRNWTPRQRTNVRYTQLMLRPRQAGQGETFDSNTQALGVQHSWGFRRSVGLVAGYQFDRTDQSLEAQVEPILMHSVQAGFSWTRRLSPIRTFSLSVLGGATQVRSAVPALGGPQERVEPRASVAANYSLSRQWGLSGSASRGVTALTGVSPDAFGNDAASVAINGIIARRLTVSVAGMWSRGTSVGSGPGTYSATNVSATLQYGFQYGGIFTGLSRYTHRLGEGLDAPGEIPPLVDRYSVRVGFTIWVPLYGAF